MDNSKLKKRILSQEDLLNFSELFKLMKPRVMSLVIFTCAVGLLTAPNLVSTKDAIIGIFIGLIRSWCSWSIKYVVRSRFRCSNV